MPWRYTVDDLAYMLGQEPRGRTATFMSVSTDTRTLSPGQVFFALPGENFDGARFVPEALAKGAAAVVTSAWKLDGVPDDPRHIVVPDPLDALQTFAAAHRERFQIPVFAVTGSCGKTTAKDMTAAVLGTRYRVIKTRGNFNNEIGCPLSLLQLEPETEFAVLELGANHLGEIARLCRIARPTESAVTLVAPAHLEGFGGIECVAAAKSEIVTGMEPGGRFYVNTDNEWTVRMGERYWGPKTHFGSRGDVFLRSWAFGPDGEMVLDIVPIGRLRLPLLVPAHAWNCLLAVAVGLNHGVTEFEAPLREACKAAARFKLLRVGGLEVLDDTYNANPASMEAALQALAARAAPEARMAALGEMLELGAEAEALHRRVGEAAAKHGVRHLFARGPNAGAMVEAARAGGVPHAEAIAEHDAIADAVLAAAAPGSTLLVKGSRGMQMERVIAEIEARIGAEKQP